MLVRRAALFLLLAAGFMLSTSSGSEAQEWNPQRLGAPLFRDPIWVYNNWSAYGLPTLRCAILGSRSCTWLRTLQGPLSIATICHTNLVQHSSK